MFRPIISDGRVMLSTRSEVWDRAGACASLFCAVHCVATPVLLASFPTLSQFLPGDESVHRVLAVAIILIGFIAFWRGYRIHRSLRVVLFAIFGITLVVWAALNPGERMTDRAETLLTVVGTCSLLLAHFQNWKCVRACCS